MQTHSDAFVCIRLHFYAFNPAELICTCKGFKISSNCSHEVAVTALFISDAQCVPGRTSFDKTYLENLVEKVAQVTRAAHIVLATCGLGPAFSRATTQSKRQGTERSLMKTWMACRCYIGTRSQPVRSPSCPCCMLPCESSLESTRRLLCMYVWSTSPAHLCAFQRIFVHSYASCSIYHAIIAARGSQIGKFRRRELEYLFMHMNAS